MKVSLKNIKSHRTEHEVKVVSEFVSLLQHELPLKTDTQVHFLEEKNNYMTTGVRFRGHIIGVLSKDRMLIDVLRTLAHEWVHEFQHQQLGLDDTKKVQDIGGPIENMSNALSGIMVKKFEKLFPQDKSVLYGQA